MPTATVEVDFADGRFALCIAKHAQIFELQDKCDAGPLLILKRLNDGSWRINDFRETIRLALIGGGMSAPDALTRVRRYVDDRPWQESIAVARAALFAAIVGVPDDPLGKPEAGAGVIEPTSESSAQKPTARARRSGSRRGKSTK